MAFCGVPSGGAPSVVLVTQPQLALCKVVLTYNMVHMFLSLNASNCHHWRQYTYKLQYRLEQIEAYGMLTAIVDFVCKVFLPGNTVRSLSLSL